MMRWTERVAQRPVTTRLEDGNRCYRRERTGRNAHGNVDIEGHG
jgi:hypothetical protein